MCWLSDEAWHQLLSCKGSPLTFRMAEACVQTQRPQIPPRSVALSYRKSDRNDDARKIQPICFTRKLAPSAQTRPQQARFPHLDRWCCIGMVRHGSWNLDLYSSLPSSSAHSNPSLCRSLPLFRGRSYVLRQPANALAVALPHHHRAHEDLDGPYALERHLALASCTTNLSALPVHVLPRQNLPQRLTKKSICTHSSDKAPTHASTDPHSRHSDDQSCSPAPKTASC